MISVTVSKIGERTSAPLFSGTFQVLEQYRTIETIAAILYSFCKVSPEIITDQVQDVLSSIDQCGGYTEKYLDCFKFVFNLPNYTKPDYLSIVLDQTKVH